MSLAELADQLAEQAVARNPNQIAIVVVYGSTAFGTQGEFSDLDMYAIVDNCNNTNLPWEFVYENHPINFWEMDWKTAEKMALGKIKSSPWAVSASLLDEGKILYARSDNDRENFQKVSKMIKREEEDNLKEIINDFNSIYSNIEIIKLAKKSKDLVSARWASWNLIIRTVVDLSKFNNTYLRKNWGSNIEEVFNFTYLPDNYSNNIEVLCTSTNFDEIILTGKELIANLRELFSKKQKTIIFLKEVKKQVMFKDLGNMLEYINKIRSACVKRDIFTASYASTELQIWVSGELAKLEFKYPDLNNFNLYTEMKHCYEKLGFPDLSDAISERNFKKIEKKAILFENHLLNYLNQLEINILRLSNLGEINLILDNFNK